MRLPTINQYIDSIANPQGLFRSLKDVLPRLNHYGEVIFISGNCSAVFKAEAGGECVAIKCYTRPAGNIAKVYSFLREIDSPYIVPCRYMPDELFVHEDNETGRYLPIAVSPWIEGNTLLVEIKYLCAQGDKDGLKSLAGEFDRMARWLLSQPFAHGDLKHDNILVQNGELRLIDLDGAYVPELAGERSASLGSPAYQHPARDEEFFGPDTDDYSIAVISLSLHALADDPSLLARYNDSENIIFNQQDIFSNGPGLLNTLREQWAANGNITLSALGDLLLSPSPALPRLREILRQICEGIGGELSGPYDVADDSDPGMALIRHNGLFGYADIAGNRVVIPAVYGEAEPFSEGLAAVTFRGHKMYIGREGLQAIACTGCDLIEPFREGAAKVGIGGKVGFMDRSGRMIVEARFDMATGFRNGKAYVKEKGSWSAIDISGQRITNEIFTSIEELKAHEAVTLK